MKKWHDKPWLKIPPKDKRIGFWEWPAYLIDIYRIFPRSFFIAASVVVYQVGTWYMFGLLAAERTTEVTAFVTIITGAWVKALDYYMVNGVDWSKRMQINGGESGAKTTTTTHTEGDN
jgi:hypothetical protein